MRRTAMTAVVIISLMALAYAAVLIAHHKTIHEKLAAYVRLGQSVEHVQAILGKGVLLTQDDNRERLHQPIQLTRANREHFPDGVNVEDVFLFYEITSNEELYLQFRDNRLINFDPSYYRRHRELKPPTLQSID